MTTCEDLPIISMVSFHICYDLAYLYALPMDWFTLGSFQDIWRCSISWTFLFLAGWSTSFSRNNLKRGLLYSAMALLVWIATSVASVDTPVNYGILFCMGASTLLFACLEKIKTPHPLLITIVALAAFFPNISNSTSNLSDRTSRLAWFSLPTFMSGDYYPLIPYFFMYMVGAGCARLFNERAKEYPSWATRRWSRLLEWIGTKSLLIYLIHQPLALLALELIFGN